jgi:hypothetical protein
MAKKTVKEYYDKKIRRNTLILENLNTPKTPEELTKIVYPKLKINNRDRESNSQKKEFRNKLRNIYNDLKFLRDLNIVDYDETRGTYQRAGIKKKVFRKAQLDMAIRHAKALIIENTSVASIFGTSRIVDCLAFNGRGLTKRKQILDHLKTGYPEIYENLKEYEKMVNESDYAPDCLKPVPIPIGSWRELPKHIAPIKEKLVGQFELRIMEPVKEGQPLLGECEQCPDKRFKILE